MIFLFPRWDMLIFPGGQANSTTGRMILENSHPEAGIPLTSLGMRRMRKSVWCCNVLGIPQAENCCVFIIIFLCLDNDQQKKKVMFKIHKSFFNCCIVNCVVLRFCSSRAEHLLKVIVHPSSHRWYFLWRDLTKLLCWRFARRQGKMCGQVVGVWFFPSSWSIRW